MLVDFGVLSHLKSMLTKIMCGSYSQSQSYVNNMLGTIV